MHPSRAVLSAIQHIEANTASHLDDFGSPTPVSPEKVDQNFDSLIVHQPCPASIAQSAAEVKEHDLPHASTEPPTSDSLKYEVTSQHFLTTTASFSHLCSYRTGYSRCAAHTLFALSLLANARRLKSIKSIKSIRDYQCSDQFTQSGARVDQSSEESRSGHSLDSYIVEQQTPPSRQQPKRMGFVPFHRSSSIQHAQTGLGGQRSRSKPDL